MARMTVLPPGSLAWLVLHEVRLNWRSRRSRTRASARWIGYMLMLGYVAFGCFLAWNLRHLPFRYTSSAGDIVLAVSIGLFSFMVTQAMLGSQRTLYEAGDLALLLSAPMAERTVLRAKLLGIAGTIVLTYTVLLLPIVVPMAMLGHPALFGVVALLAALAVVAACIGLGLTLLLAVIAGPRAARTVGQIAAAMLGGGVFIVSQILSHGDRTNAGRVALFELLRKSKIGEGPVGALPGRAVFGDPAALLLLAGTSLALLMLTGIAFQRSFLTSYQAAGMRLSRAAPSRLGIARHFRSGLFGSVFAKEMRLLQRDPALAFQIVLRIIYLAPLMIAGFGGGHVLPLAPVLAFTSVAVIGQLTSSFAWLTISAEDAPDLIAVAPVEKEQIDMAKLFAAIAMAAPLGIILPIAVATQTVIGAMATLLLTAITGILAGLIELKFGKPMPRKSFNQRRGSGAVAGILAALLTLVMGGLAGVTVYALESLA
jgi:ABC-2 type transport system permease protein